MNTVKMIVLSIILFAGSGFAASKELPKMLELGSVNCIPCKMMAPIIEDFKKNYSDKFAVEFIDVNNDRAAAKKYSISVIPTQVFLDASGKEVFRHIGFFPKEDILSKWKELGFSFENKPAVKVESKPVAKADVKPESTFKRFEPAQTDNRSKDTICYMCDKDISNSMVTVKTAKGDVKLCGLHCYHIMYSCMTEDKTGIEDKVTISDYKTKEQVPLLKAVILYGMDERIGRPTLKAFTNKDDALAEKKENGGNIVSAEVLKAKELASRCGFCDRSVYPEDAALVKADGVHTYGCCSHCALGVAVRTGKDIEVYEKDRLTGEKIVVKTHDGKIASLEPKTAVAWFGQKKNKEGKFGSAGCFHQCFFVNEENLKKWVEQNPLETGEMISIEKALADKMALKKEQIMKACKIGECAPK
ncbi:MAG: hypothetical protein A2231_00185 [Candidatus Firestonebacteria bacterium RIFOXYA2_FULL_40_8]|nr:MAG: hypothetical protein A2231_00185 [Candidatus Firestonebacteria bacterium RIFOXYA2_FULL_40_8]